MVKEILKYIIDKIIESETKLYKSQPQGTKKRVLIFRKDGLGDCILFYPTLKTYRDFFSTSEVTILLPKWFKELSPLLDPIGFEHIIWFDHKAFGKNILYRRRFLIDLKKQGYDIVIYPVFTREAVGDLIVKITGAKEITPIIPTSISREIDRDIYYAEQITGKKAMFSFPTINPADLPKSMKVAENILHEHNLEKRRFAIIFPGAGANYRIWPSDHFAKIIDHIMTQNIIPVVCGGPKEKDLAQLIISKTINPSNIVDLSGQTDLPTLTHIISHAQFYFGSDTGVLHLAAALDIPSIALMGSGGYHRFFPYGNLERNRVVCDMNYLNSHPENIGNWDDAKTLQSGEIHPSILGISIEAAKKEIDYMIDFINLKK